MLLPALHNCVREAQPLALPLLAPTPCSPSPCPRSYRVEAVIQGCGAAVVWVSHDPGQPGRVGGRVLNLPLGSESGAPRGPAQRAACLAPLAAAAQLPLTASSYLPVRPAAAVTLPEVVTPTHTAFVSPTTTFESSPSPQKPALQQAEEGQAGPQAPQQ